MATLYEIDQALMECFDEETGEITNEELFDQLNMFRDEKIEKVILWYKNLLSDAEAYKREKDSFAERETQAKKKAGSLKIWIESALNGDKFKTNKVSVSYRKSESVNVIDVTKVDKDYLKPVVPEVDKTKVKEALKNGVHLDGVELIQKNNMQIR